MWPSDAKERYRSVSNVGPDNGLFPADNKPLP